MTDIDRDPTAGLTDSQRRLYDEVIGDWSGRELRQVIAAADASEVDKQAVTRILYSN